MMQGWIEKIEMLTCYGYLFMEECYSSQEESLDASMKGGERKGKKK